MSLNSGTGSRMVQDLSQASQHEVQDFSRKEEKALTVHLGDDTAALNATMWSLRVQSDRQSHGERLRVRMTWFESPCRSPCLFNQISQKSPFCLSQLRSGSLFFTIQRGLNAVAGKWRQQPDSLFLDSLRRKEDPPAGPTALQLEMSPQVGMTHFPFTFILVRRGQKS